MSETTLTANGTRLFANETKLTANKGVSKPH
jgi:hypothetical protein